MKQYRDEQAKAIRKSAEMRVLLACLPVSQQGWVDRDAVIEALRAGSSGLLDWMQLLTLAGYHGMVPMLTHALAACGWKSVPPAIRRQLEHRHMQHVKGSLRSVAALHELHGYFERLDLGIASWKGPVLAAGLYGSCALRESGDLDLLVPAERLEEATQIVEFLDFKPHAKADRASTCRLVAKLDQEHCFYRAADGIYLELHTQVLPERFTAWQDMAGPMSRTAMQPLGTQTPGAPRTVRTLNVEDHLISLCGHGIKHHWERLKWLADVAMVLRVHAETLDWRGVVAKARRSGRLGALMHSYLLAERVFGVRLPKALDVACGPALEALTSRVAEWLAAGQMSELPHALATEQLALLFPSRAGRMGFAVRRLTTPQLVDLQSASPAGAMLAQLRRMHAELHVGGMFGKTLAQLRTIW